MLPIDSDSEIGVSTKIGYHLLSGTTSVLVHRNGAFKPANEPMHGAFGRDYSKGIT